MLLKIAPITFVLLWSTGFIFSKLGAPHAEPFTFLAIRFAFTLALLLPACLVLSAPWPSLRIGMHAAVAGALIHAAYLAGTLLALRAGMPTAVTALIMSLQPILTAFVAAPLVGEQVTARHWFGLALGFAGAILVLLPRFELPIAAGADGITPASVAGAGLGLVAITAGALYQKRFVAEGDLRTVTAWQYMGALLACSMLCVFESQPVAWTRDLVIALGWLVLLLSLGAVSLLMLMIRQNAVSRVASLFYLVLAVTALIGAGLFGERLMPVQIVGMVIVAAAVFTIARAKPAG
jgi:drug/metabolite transporter (DMT)-like permease